MFVVDTWNPHLTTPSPSQWDFLGKSQDGYSSLYLVDHEKCMIFILVNVLESRQGAKYSFFLCFAIKEFPLFQTCLHSFIVTSDNTLCYHLKTARHTSGGLSSQKFSSLASRWDLSNPGLFTSGFMWNTVSQHSIIRVSVFKKNTLTNPLFNSSPKYLKEFQLLRC